MTNIAKFLHQDININIIGKRNTGKSYLTKYILKSLFINNMLDYVIIISGTLYTGFQDCIPKKYQFYPEQAVTIIPKILEFQRKNIKNNIHAGIILDDCLRGINFKSS